MASRPRMSRCLHPLALVLLVACASTRGKACHDDDDTTTHATTAATAATTGPSTSGTTAGDIDDTDVAAVDRALQGLLGEIGRASCRERV